MVSIRDGEPTSGHSRQCYLKPSVRSTVVVSCWVNTLPTSYLRSFSYYRFYIDTTFFFCLLHITLLHDVSRHRRWVRKCHGLVFRGSRVALPLGAPGLDIFFLLNTKNDLSVHALQI